MLTGLHASGLAVSPDGRYVVCANAGSDHLSVIDTRTDAVVETIWAKPKPSDLFGASPNALAFDPIGQAALRRQRHAERHRRVRLRAGGTRRIEAARADPRRLVSRRARCSTPAARRSSPPTSRACPRRRKKPTTAAPRASTRTSIPARCRWCRSRRTTSCRSFPRSCRDNLPHAADRRRRCCRRARTSRRGRCPSASASRA